VAEILGRHDDLLEQDVQAPLASDCSAIEPSKSCRNNPSCSLAAFAEDRALFYGELLVGSRGAHYCARNRPSKENWCRGWQAGYRGSSVATAIESGLFKIQARRLLQFRRPGSAPPKDRRW
jgi:hypothetical protein